MTKKPSTYKIQKGDTLGSIAKYLNIPKEKLQALNSDQIKSADFIYAGNVLNVDVGTRTQQPENPGPAAGCTTCKSKLPVYVDILYVPVHPVTGKKIWYAVTEKAAAAITSEQALLAGAVSAKITQEEKLTKLNDLGILSKFESKVHSQFLDKNDADELRDLNLLLSNHIFKTNEKGERLNKEAFIKEIAENKKLGYETIKAKYERMFESGRQRARLTVEQDLMLSREPVTLEEKKIAFAELEVKFKQHILNEVTRNIVSQLEKKVDDLEKKAITAAKGCTTKDKTNFVYDKKHKYYTSEKQKKIFSWIQKYIGEEYRLGIDYSAESDTFTCSHLKDFWKEYLNIYSQSIHPDVSPEKRILSFPLIYSRKTRCVSELNYNGYVFKEQCLKFDELAGSTAEHFGPSSLSQTGSKYNKWREDKGLKIDFDDRYSVIKGLFLDCGLMDYFIDEKKALLPRKKSSGKGSKDPVKKLTNEQIEGILDNSSFPPSKWAYYPTLALIRFIDTTVTQWLADVKTNIGAPIPGLFNNILLIKKIALARIKRLKSVAHDRVNKKETLFCFYNKDVIPVKNEKYILIWDLNKYTPLKMNKLLTGKGIVFNNEAGKANIQVIECTLLSTLGKVGWVRGVAWYLPAPKVRDPFLNVMVDPSNGHLKEITSKVSFVNPLSGGSTPEQGPKAVWDGVKKKLQETVEGVVKNSIDAGHLNLNKVIKCPDSAFWSNEYHWKKGVSAEGATYAVDAQSQFLRFSAGATGVGELPFTKLNGIKPNLGVSAEGKTELHLDVARGQVSFTMALPKKGVQKLSIPYVAKKEGGGVEEKEYDAGNFKGEFMASLYGFAGASCVLSADIAFGPSSTGKIGVRGQSIKTTDFNQMVDDSLGSRVTEVDSKMLKSVSVDASAKIDVFAGVEVGVASNIKCFWQPPRDDKAAFMELGSVGAQVSVSAGAGLSADIRLMLHNGKLTAIISAKAVCGVGVSGEWSVSLNALVADRFLGCLLGILNESGFRYVSVLGDVDEDGENPAFVLLNTYITSALLLGITLAEVLLLPIVLLESYNKASLQKKYSLQIAEYLLEWERIQEKGAGRLWINNLPPEVLANLLNCLTTKETEGIFEWHSTFEKDLNKASSIKVRAIALIFKWMAPLKVDEHDNVKVANCCRQFEKTLILMGGHAETAATFGVKWKRFAASFNLIKRFVSSVQIDNINNKNNVMDTAISILNTAAAILGSKMQGYRYTSKFDGAEYYIAHRHEFMAVGVCEAPVKEQSMEQLMSEIEAINEAIKSEHEAIQDQKAIAKDKDAVAFNEWKIK